MSVKLTNVIWVDETVSVFGRVKTREPEGTRLRTHCEVWVDKPDGSRALLGEASALDDG